MKEYYVVLTRLFGEKDYVYLMDKEEAVKRRWVDNSGNRIWVVPSADERSATFVWGFDDSDVALTFAENLSSEVGMEVEYL